MADLRLNRTIYTLYADVMGSIGSKVECDLDSAGAQDRRIKGMSPMNTRRFSRLLPYRPSRAAVTIHRGLLLRLARGRPMICV
ncbi:hypothetical protein BDV12DRAFT_176353 [Aspergillus spectabilis]